MTNEHGEDEIERESTFLHGYAMARFMNESDVENVLSNIASLDSDAVPGELLAKLRRQIRIHYHEKYSTLDARANARDSAAKVLADPFEMGPRPSIAHTQKLAKLPPDLFWEASRECLSMLNPVQAEVYILREMENVSCDDIAEIFGVAFEDVLELVYRGRMVFVKCLLKRIDKH